MYMNMIFCVWKEFEFLFWTGSCYAEIIPCVAEDYYSQDLSRLVLEIVEAFSY